MGEAKRKALVRQEEPIVLDTFGGRIHVEWDPAAAVTPLGQLPFFIEFLKVSGLFDAWVADCPLVYESNRAPDKRAVLATFLLSILVGHHRYAHITAIRHDGVHPELLGVRQLVSEDAARRALARMDESAGVAWLDAHLAKTTQPLLSTPWILDLDTTVKCLYGKQEGALVGYNPKKPGRPSHSYHSALMANTRLALAVEVMAGNETAPVHSMPGIWGVAGFVAQGAAPRFAARGCGLRQRVGSAPSRSTRTALSHQAAIDEEREGSDQEVVSRRELGRRGTRMGRFGGHVDTLGLEPGAACGGVGRLHHAGPRALPADGAHGGARL